MKQDYKFIQYLDTTSNVGVGVFSWDKRRNKICCQWFEGKYTGKKTRNKIFLDYYGNYIVKNDIKFYVENFIKV